MLGGLPNIFNRVHERKAADEEVERNRLYQQIGKLQVEVDWLKRRLDISAERRPKMPVYRPRSSHAQYHPAMQIDRTIPRQQPSTADRPWRKRVQSYVDATHRSGIFWRPIILALILAILMILMAHPLALERNQKLFFITHSYNSNLVSLASGCHRSPTDRFSASS